MSLGFLGCKEVQGMVSIQNEMGTRCKFTSVEAIKAECTKIARFSAAAVANFYRSPKNRAIFFEARRCAISSAKKIASELRFLLRRKW